jgi:DNA (cytosine-5)-methyltransferase 1
MKLLDLFCGAGGAAMGYHRAGFDDITGIDNRPQKHYPFQFVQADAFDYLREHGREFDVIHASPPCQAFSSMRFMWNAKRDHIDLLTPCRELLIHTGKPYVIENVYGAPLILPLMLCGTSFHLRTKDGLGELRRHRYFESSVSLGLTPPCQHNGPVIGVYGGHGRDRRRVSVPVLSKVGGNYNRRMTVEVNGHAGGFSRRDGTHKFNTEARKEAMGIDWMNGDELSQAIPPAYTEWIGKQLLQALSMPGPSNGRIVHGTIQKEISKWGWKERVISKHTSEWLCPKCGGNNEVQKG